MSYIKKLIFAGVVISLTSGFSTSLYAQKFYKWMDANGSTHYTTTPPPKNARNVSQVHTYNDNSRSTSTTTPPPSTSPQPTSTPSEPKSSRPAPAKPEAPTSPPAETTSNQVT